MLILRVTIIQKTVRGWIHRIQFKQMKTAAIIIEKYWRGYVQRQRYRQVFSNLNLLIYIKFRRFKISVNKNNFNYFWHKTMRSSHYSLFLSIPSS